MAADDDGGDDPSSFSNTDFVPTSHPAGSSSAGSSQQQQHTAAAARAPLPRKQLMETWLLLEFCNRGCLSDAVEKGWFRQPAARGTPSGLSVKGDGSCESSFSGGLTCSPPDLAAILATAREVAAAMSYLHHKNILHGDLTGGNVLLTAAPAEARGFTAKVREPCCLCQCVQAS
jgi:serine/threonine protein kinase